MRHLRKFQASALLLLLSALSTAQAESRYSLQILSATVKDQHIAGATVILQKNGEQAVTGVTNAQGQVTLTAPFDDDTGAMLIIKKTGFSNLVVKCPCAGMT